MKEFALLVTFLVGVALGTAGLVRKAYAAGYSDAYAEGLTRGIAACKE